MRVPIFFGGKTNQEIKMKYALIGAAAVVAQLPQLPHWRNRLSKTPAIARSSTRMQIVKTWGRAIRPPMAATIVMAGKTTTRPGNGMSNVTIRRVADNEMEAGLAVASICKT